MWDHAVPMQEYDPQVFFKANRWIVTYKGDLKWQLNQVNDGSSDGSVPVHINVSSLNTNWTWMPIQDEYVNIDNEELDPSLIINNLEAKRILGASSQNKPELGGEVQ